MDRVLDLVLVGGSTLLVRENHRYRDLVEVGQREMVHTRVLTDDRSRSGFAYTDAMHAARRLVRRPASRLQALCLGGGGGVVARQLDEAGLHVDVVEASAPVIDLASRYFGLRRSSSLAVHHADAADFVVRSSAERYDLVFIDLFGAFEASPLLASRTFFDTVRRCLRPGGALAVNSVGALDGGAGAMLATHHAVGAVFPHHLSIPMLSNDERATGTLHLHAPRNVVSFAMLEPLPAAVPTTETPANMPALSTALHDLNARLHALDAASAQASAGLAMVLD